MMIDDFILLTESLCSDLDAAVIKLFIMLSDFQNFIIFKIPGKIPNLQNAFWIVLRLSSPNLII